MNDKTTRTWLSRLKSAALSKARPASLLAATALAATALPGCLDRPIGEDGPRTTNILVDLLNQSVVDKIDLLFVVDNSLSMGDKQAIMAEAVPDLVARFVTPICLGEGGAEVPRNGGDCPPGSSPEFNAIEDINIGIITTSLGGFGADTQCQVVEGRPYTNQRADMARLVGSLPRATDLGGNFLEWRANGQDVGALIQSFEDQVERAGEQGCGFEAPLEAWVRFLVDPYPYTRIVRRDCTAGSGDGFCAGPEADADGNQARDDVILAQRAAFMRMDSLLAVIMLTDENDCSFKSSGQAWLLADTSRNAFKGSQQCAADPNDACCQSCGAPVTNNCPSEGGDGETALGCTEAQYPAATTDGPPSEDDINLRCFKQKQRFGVDFLFPVQRYANALEFKQICPFADDLDPQSSRCPNGTGVVNNPVFARGDDVRPESQVFLGGIVGVPWQDLAQDPAADVLKFRKAQQEDNDPTGATLINWDWLLGAPDSEGNRAQYPTNDGVIDPLMYESVDPREGTNPATGEALAPPGANFGANSINGHEWNIYDRSDLQYACVFPLPPDRVTVCPTEAEAGAMEDDPMYFEDGVPNCDCTRFGGELAGNPLCQDPNTNEFDGTQRYAKAYPSIRPLQALELFAKANATANAIVASICPKYALPSDNNRPDYGYRPAVATIVDRLKEQLQEPCLPRPLGTKDDDSAACILIEATTAEDGCTGAFRSPITEQRLTDNVYEQLEAQGWCGRSDAPCSSYKLCEVPQVKPGDAEYLACIQGGGGDQGDGWCYVDRDKLPAGVNEDLVEELLSKCPETQKRKLRFVGEGRPSSNALTFYACSGALFSTADQ